MMKKHNTGKRLLALAAVMAAALALTSISPMSHVQAASQAEQAGYTFTDVTGIWCTLEDAPVYSLPSADSVPFGILPKDTSLNVTGICDQTKWFRIDYNGVEGYVDRSYLEVGSEYKDLTQLRESFINHIVAGHLTWTDSNGNNIKDRATLENTLTPEVVSENYDYIKYYDNYCDVIFAPLLMTNGFDRHTAEEIWCAVKRREKSPISEGSISETKNFLRKNPTMWDG